MRIFQFLFLILAPCAFLLSQESTPEKKRAEYLIAFGLDNDYIFTTDHYYTAGAYLGFVTSSNSFEESYLPRFLGRFLDKLPGLNPVGRTSQLGFSCVQRIFTPDDFNDPNLIKNDLPYSGQLILNLTLSTQNKRHLDAHTFSIGFAGPRSRAEEVQTTIHYLSVSPLPMGWDNQIKNEVLLNLFYEHRFKFYEHSNVSRNFDSIMIGAGGIGNITSYIELGFGCRSGKNIPDDFFMQSPMFADSTIGLMPTTHDNKNFAWYFFGYVGASAVANAIYLDGNTFVESNSVKYDPLGARIVAGFAMEYLGIHTSVSVTGFTIPWDNPQNDFAEFYTQVSLYYLF